MMNASVEAIAGLRGDPADGGGRGRAVVLQQRLAGLLGAEPERANRRLLRPRSSTT